MILSLKNYLRKINTPEYDGFWTKSYGIISVIIPFLFTMDVIEHLIARGNLEPYWLLGITIVNLVNFFVMWGCMKLILTFKIIERIQDRLMRLRKN